MRLFIGIDLPPHIKQSLFNTQLRLIESGVKGYLKPQDSFHITLEFLDELPSESVPLLTQLMEEVVHDKKSFKLHMNKFGAFPSFIKPHTIWIGVGGHLNRLEEIWIFFPYVQKQKSDF